MSRHATKFNNAHSSNLKEKGGVCACWALPAKPGRLRAATCRSSTARWKAVPADCPNWRPIWFAGGLPVLEGHNGLSKEVSYTPADR